MPQVRAPVPVLERRMMEPPRKALPVAAHRKRERPLLVRQESVPGPRELEPGPEELGPELVQPPQLVRVVALAGKKQGMERRTHSMMQPGPLCP